MTNYNFRGGTIIDQLEKMRAAIRFGLVKQATEIFAAVPASFQTTPDWQIEFGFLQLLKFVNPANIKLPEIKQAGDETECRLLILKGIISNRLRDPLSALAHFTSASSLSDAAKLPFCKLAALLELARVYVWFGNTLEAQDKLLEVLARAEGNDFAIYRFLAFCRLADLYAELEQWKAAKRYVELAETLEKPFRSSVHWFQLQDCAARSDLGLGLDATRHVAPMQNADAELAPYMQFRWRVLQFENLLVQDINRAAKALAEVESVPTREDSFEKIVTNVLRAKFDLRIGRPKLAIASLAAARDWFSDQDLSIRVVETQLLLARAFAADNQQEPAAAELDSTRNYCLSRNLNAQLEKTETTFAELGLSLHPIVETRRMTSENAWKNRQAYVVLKKLGAGGQGEVYLAHDNARRKNVALKKLNMVARNSPNQLAALEREVRGANAAMASGMARIIACGQESEGIFYIVQDFIEGKSLRKEIETGKPSLHLLAGLAETLATLHAGGVVHGDVKPENVIITPEGSTMLVDFGLASLSQDKKQKLIGATARYAPPALSTIFHDAAWRDRYAFGLIVLECLGAVLPDQFQKTLFLNSRALNSIIAKLPKSPARTLALELLSPFSFTHKNWSTAVRFR